MSDSHDLVISHLLHQQSIAMAEAEKAREIAAAPKIKREIVSSRVPQKSKPTGGPGTLDARGFMLALREAGNRLITGEDGKTHKVHQADQVRSDKIKAMQAFIGYDNTKDFGPQLMAAEMKAKSKLQPIDISGPSRSEQRRIQSTVKGYVAGARDGHAAKMADLKGRERMAVEALLKYEKEGLASADENERNKLLALRDFEIQRLKSIRAEIDKAL